MAEAEDTRNVYRILRDTLSGKVNFENLVEKYKNES
jgi:hypothetical protein